MNDRERREFERALSCLLVLTKYAVDFETIVVVAAAIAVLQTETDRLSALGAEKISARSGAKDATIFKGDLRDALIDALQDIADMWRPMAKNFENAQNKFRISYGSDQLIVDTAGSFIADAAPLRDAFTERGMNGNFITDLTAKKDAFEAVVNESEEARLRRVGANAGFREPLRKCREVIEDVDPIIRMVFRDQPAKLAEWLSASHVERAPQHPKSTP